MEVTYLSHQFYTGATTFCQFELFLREYFHPWRVWVYICNIVKSWPIISRHQLRLFLFYFYFPSVCCHFHYGKLNKQAQAVVVAPFANDRQMNFFLSSTYLPVCRLCSLLYYFFLFTSFYLPLSSVASGLLQLSGCRSCSNGCSFHQRQLSLTVFSSLSAWPIAYLLFNFYLSTFCVCFFITSER